ncbi:MAG: NAD(P)H-hydrate dehydratase, partial [Flavobacteriaceae bacterium]|nr:NAD(P)H-hydrate dehydratase [Flavobacteriaceae bacterium]
QRPKYAHKGHFGHSLLVGGSKGKIGAMALATKAALRSGSGLTTSFVPACGHDSIVGHIPEAMVITDEHNDIITHKEWELEPYTIGVGPGMGQNEETLTALKALLAKAQTPLVVDADAINLIAGNMSLMDLVPKGSIFTPHPGELKRLIGAWENDMDKLEKTKAFSKEHEVILIVKGANSITVFGDDLYINSTGNPGMATAGSGDVLTGMITGLLAQDYEPLVAAMFGVYQHGSAGNLATQELGFEALMASDIIEHIGMAFLELFRQEPPPGAAAENEENHT